MNDDLTDYEFKTQDGATIKVTGPASWSEQYVDVDITYPDGLVYESVRPAKLVRLAKNQMPCE